MKKILYSLIFISLFINFNILSLESDEITFDNLDKVEDAMDDSSDIKDVVTPALPEVVEVSNEIPQESVVPINLENKVLGFDSYLPDTLESYPNLTEENTIYQSTPDLTKRISFQEDINMHKDISEKYFALQRVLESLIKKLGNRLDVSSQQHFLIHFTNNHNFSEAELALIENMKNVSVLCGQAATAHAKIVMIYESFQDLEKADFAPGEKLEAMVAGLSNKATEVTFEADKEMKELLGLKPILNFKN